MHISPQDYLFVFTLGARTSDVLTTWLVTPRLKLEANPLARKFRWPFAFLTLFTAFFAFWEPAFAVWVATVSFLVAGNNATRIAPSRTLGEDKLFEMAVAQSGMGSFWPGLLWRMAPIPFYLGLALLIFFLCPSPEEWGFHVAYGVVIYVVVYGLYGTLAYVRLRRLSKKSERNSQSNLVQM